MNVVEKNVRDSMLESGPCAGSSELATALALADVAWFASELATSLTLADVAWLTSELATALTLTDVAWIPNHEGFGNLMSEC